MTAAGFVARTGWAVVVVVDRSQARPRVLHRDRIELVRDLPANVYHRAVELTLDEAEALVDAVRNEADAAAHAAVAGLIRVHGVTAVGVVTGGTRLPDSLAPILASHALVHAAEGELYRDALIDAATDAGVAVHLTPTAALDGDDLAPAREHLASLGRELGPPWRREQKDAALAAVAALAHLPAA